MSNFWGMRSALIEDEFEQEDEDDYRGAEAWRGA